MSQKRTSPPRSPTTSLVAKKLKAVVSTRSPGPIPAAIRERSRASVPLATATQ